MLRRVVLVLGVAALGLLAAWRVVPRLTGRPFAPESLRERYAVLGARLETWRRGGRVVRAIEYERVGDWSGRLDLYLPAAAREAVPILVWFHGGGWVEGSRDLASLAVQPYARMGFAVANVSYRLAWTATAPAAVEDARCAVRWVATHGARYGLDTTRIVTAGVSAGGHLALMAAFAQPGDSLDGACGPTPPVAAVVNWYGPTDLGDMAAQGSGAAFVRAWLGSEWRSPSLQRRMSPLARVHAGAPPVLTIHGARDPLVPVHEARALHDSLQRAGVANRLIVVPEGGHGFPRATGSALLDSVALFLRSRNVLPDARSRPR